MKECIWDLFDKEFGHHKMFLINAFILELLGMQVNVHSLRITEHFTQILQ